MIYAEVTQLDDRYSVDIHPEDLFLETINFDSIRFDLKNLGYTVKQEIKIDDDLWHFILDDNEVKEKIYNGYGLIIDYYKVSEVVSVLDSGRSKDGKHFLPSPGTELAKDSKQIGNVIVYQNKDQHLIWSSNKQKLDVVRRKVIEWRRNHRFLIEKFL